MASSLNQPHIAICPGSGMGHLNPFLRLTSMLCSVSSAKVTLVIIRPSISTAEAEHITTFLSSHPHIHSSEFYTLPCDNDPSISPDFDPFFFKYAAICRSASRLAGHLASLSPPVNAVFSDIMLASGLNKAFADLSLPNFTVITTSARFFSFMACLPLLPEGETKVLNPIPEDEIPGGPVLFFRDFPFLRLMDTNYKFVRYASGIIINSFDFLDPVTTQALNSRSSEFLTDLPPVFPIGPLLPLGAKEDKSGDTSYLPWLDGKPLNSVVYVSFGSRTAMSTDQIRELGDGLDRSGAKFLWVVKTTKVDKEEGGELIELLGEGFFERTKDRGLVVKGWVNQDEILAHPSIGGFVTHCGWNSVTEAALRGTPMLAWPRQDEQRVNARLVEKAGLGIWDVGWGWGEELVKSDAIAEKIKELMTSKTLRETATKVGEEAVKAWEVGGSSRQMLEKLLGICNIKMAS